MSRLLGIDFGEKRIGIALSDEGVRLAFPHTIILNNNDSVPDIFEILEKYDVSKVIIGESKDYNMRENRIMEDARDFAEELKKEFLEKKETELEIIFHPEFMTSVQVEKTHFQLSERHKDRGVEKSKKLDAQAAAIMLQSYIDSNK